jgi:hypothetical protein
MSATHSFDASARSVSDSESRAFADQWFLSDGKDLTRIDGLSFGHLLRLPVFLSAQNKQSASWTKLIRAMSSCIGNGARLWLSKQPTSSPTHGREYVFLLTKSVPHGAIAKHLEPIMHALHSRGETVVIWTFDEAARVALHAQYPLWRCENVTQTHVGFIPLIRLASMLGSVCVSLLRSPARGDYLQPLTTLFFHAPRFLALDAALKKKLRPGLVVISSTEMHPLERLIFTRANEQWIPTVLVQHGVTNETVKNLIVNTPSIASRLCVWGQSAKRYFIKHGVPSDRVVVTGSPALPTSPNPSLARRGELRQMPLAHFSLPGLDYILFSGQHFDGEKNTALAQMMLDAFASFLKTHTSAKLVITPHPAKSPFTTPDFYRCLLQENSLQENKQVFICPATTHVHDLLRASRVLVTSSSTLHVEATLLKTPVILLNIDDVPDMELVEQGAGLGAHNVIELVNALEASAQPSVLEELAAHRDSFLMDYVNLPGDPVTLATAAILEIATPL